MNSALNPCHLDAHSDREHGITVHVELCVVSLFLAELRQNMKFGHFYVFLRRAVYECSDVSEKLIATETSQKLPTAPRKIPTDHKLTNKNTKPYKIKISKNFITKSQYKCHIMNGHTAVLNGAAYFYTFGTKRHNVKSALNYAPRSFINHCLIWELENGVITPWNIKLSRRWVEIDSFITQPLFPYKGYA